MTTRAKSLITPQGQVLMDFQEGRGYRIQEIRVGSTTVTWESNRHYALKLYARAQDRLRHAWVSEQSHIDVRDLDKVWL
jgi:hypothetical protein